MSEEPKEKNAKPAHRKRKGKKVSEHGIGRCSFMLPVWLFLVLSFYGLKLNKAVNKNTEMQVLWILLEYMF